MATLFKKPGSPYYWLRFSHNGKRYQESTKKRFNQHNAAQKVADEREAEVKGSGSYSELFTRTLAAIDKLPEKDQSCIRREFAKQLLSGRVSKLKLSDAFEAFKKKPLKGNPSAKQLSNYENVWTKFNEWIADNAKTVEWMHEIDHSMAVGFCDNLWAKGLTARTYNVYLTQLRRIFKSLALEGGMLANPFDGIDAMPLQTQGKEPLSAEQLRAVMAKATGEMRTLLVIGLYTGLRLGDAALLSWSEVDLSARTITLVPRKTRKTRKKPIVIPIHSTLVETLANLPRSRTGYIMPRLAADYQITVSLVSDRVRDVFVAAELETRAKREDGRGRAVCRYGFHSLRHSFVSLCHASNVPQTAVMEMVGHSSDAVHAIYQHADAETKRKGVALLPDITKEAGS